MQLFAPYILFCSCADRQEIAKISARCLTQLLIIGVTIGETEAVVQRTGVKQLMSCTSIFFFTIKTE